MTPIIKVENLTREFKQYKKEPGFRGSIKAIFKREYRIIPAVNSISFEIDPGEFVGFIGANGAGKTTTLKMLSGLLHPTTGNVEVLGYQPFQRKHEFLKQIALVMGQKSQMWMELPAREVFLLNKDLYEIPDDKFNTVLNDLTEMMDVEDILDIQVRKLSLGQRMKCEIMASILHAPKVLFLDEPTIGLDILIQKRIRNFLNDYNKEFGTTILLTSHNMDDVNELCKRLIVIDKGEIIYDGNINQLSQNYVNDKTLKIVFDQDIAKKDLQRYGKVTEITNQSCTIIVPKLEHSKIAADILNKFKVNDLDVQEMSLQDIVLNIFEKSKK